MKPANRAPAYATLYPGLCELARVLGYTLAIHGSLADDLDLIAIPWTEKAVEADELVSVIVEHCEICMDRKVPAEFWKPEDKPHGRRAWKIFFENGFSVDLSVMPLK